MKKPDELLTELAELVPTGVLDEVDGLRDWLIERELELEVRRLLVCRDLALMASRGALRGPLAALPREHEGN